MLRKGKKFHLDYYQLMGGGVESIHKIFICKNNRKSKIITHCVERISSCKYQGQQFSKGSDYKN